MIKNNISVIRLMMIISQLLLAVFLGYWLFAQYNEKKEIVSKDITRGLRHSEEQLIDSLLYKNIINPFISDSSSFSMYMADSIDMQNPITMEMNIDTIPHMIMQITSEHNPEMLVDPNIIKSIHRIDSSDIGFDQNLASTITVRTEQDTNNPLLFQGVKLLINTVGKFDLNQENIYSFFAPNLDTTLLVDLFTKYLSSSYTTFNLEWKTLGDSISPSTKGQQMEFPSLLFEHSYGVKITNYRSYIISSIFSQILFAFILLTITAIAFRLAFSSLKSQRKLITLKNDFISNITHELKTPVSTVKVALEALIDFNQSEDPVRSKEYLEMANSEMERLDLLVNQVLSNSSLEDGNGFINKEPIDLISITRDVIRSLQNRINDQRAAINIEHSDDQIIIEGDKLHIHGVITNLVDNSLKYCNIKPEINIKIDQDNKYTTITLRDNGIGIPEEYKDKIFDKFFRVPKGDEHSVKGYGLGLNYAQLVMKNHGGSINVTKNNPDGSTFIIRLPHT